MKKGAEKMVDGKYTIETLNQMDQEEFVTALGGIFEDTPSIASRAWSLRPFSDVSDLYQKMWSVVQAMSPAEQLAFIQAHPDLGAKVQMTDASVKEQAGAGLNQLTTEEYEEFNALNQAYKQKFGFPFIIAVKSHTTLSILDNFRQRMGNVVEVEREKALAEIAKIARFRLIEIL